MDDDTINKMRAARDVFENAMRAAEALRWVKTEMRQNVQLDDNDIMIRASVGYASACRGGKQADHYFSEAAKMLHTQVFQIAIALMQRDLEAVAGIVTQKEPEAT